MDAVPPGMLMIMSPESVSNNNKELDFELSHEQGVATLIDSLHTDDVPANLKCISTLPPAIHIPVAPHCKEVGVYTKQGPFHENEDRVLVIEDFGSFLEENGIHDVVRQQMTVLLVLDGHGGSWTSSYVHQYFARALTHHFTLVNEEENNLSPETISHVLSNTIDQLEREVVSRCYSTQQTSGCCLLAAIICEETVVVANVGDCRAIMLGTNPKTGQEYKGDGCLQLTADHTPRNKSERIRILSEGGTIRDNRISGLLEPSRSLGDIDFKPKNGRRILIADAEMHTYPAPEGNILVLATDGIWDVLANYRVCGQLQHFIRRGDSASQAAKALVDYSSSCQSCDDISAIIVYL